MRLFVLAAVAALGGPLLTKDEASAPPATVKFASVPPDMVLSDNLIGLNIVDGTNSNVGEIKDIVIEKGKLAGYIVSVGGFLGMGERYVVIDPSSVALTYDAGAKKWKASVNASKDALKAAPEFKYDGKFKR